MKKSNILKMGIMGTLILIVLVSGCTSNSSTTKTFSDGVMSFNYPSDFKETSSDSGYIMQIIGKLGNSNLLNTQIILVGKNTNGTPPAEIRDKVILKVKNMSGEVLSTSTETNPNGIVVERSTYEAENSMLGRTINYDMFFKIDGVVYGISVFGPDSNKQQIINTTNMGFQSIK